jgi:lysophospholipase L1-like esterase
VHGRFTTNYFYSAWVYYGALYLSKVINRTKTDLGNQSATITNGVAYKLSLIMSGTTITAQLHRVSDGALLAEVIRTDSSITNSGQHGVSGATTAPFTLDNYSSALAIDNAVSETDSGAGVDAVSAADSSGNKNPVDIGSGSDTIGISVTAPAFDAGQGQDSVSITVSVNMGDSGTGADTPAVIEPAMLALLERFDETLDNWTLDASGGSVQIQTVNNDEKLVLSDTSSSALVSATRSIEGQSAPFCIEADIYAASGAIGLLEALDAAGNVIFSIKADAGAGQGAFDADNDTASTFTFSAGAYYQIVFFCDTFTDAVRAWYITGTGTAPSAWTAIGAAKSYSGALIAKIRLTTDTTATGEVRFDEVKVFRPNVFCIGDSNTAGYKSSSPYWNPVPSSAQRLGAGEDETHSYPYWLSLKYTPDQWAANRGLNAAQSADLDARIQGDVIDQGAQAVVILIGTNDISGGVALAALEANIQSAADKAATAGLTVCLCSVPPRNAWDSAQNAKRASLNAWIQSHSAANGYRFADVYSAVKAPSNPDQLEPAYDSGDGLHFTTTGLQFIADTVYSALLETKIMSPGKQR